jgi:hypothetical protein
LIPPECCQLLVQGLSEQLLKLPVRFEDAEVPLWADSAGDYKEVVGAFRSQVGRKDGAFLAWQGWLPSIILIK